MENQEEHHVINCRTGEVTICFTLDEAYGLTVKHQKEADEEKSLLLRTYQNLADAEDAED